ncbi:segregation and condensation protein A [Aneurinibacillus tyrosinisolvens]|uniref:segregation and condensation protein A n=1 Tax=Aneurinibacillus tyrosinisolvens TaxID=1443435 RepID=UPI000ABEF77A|nr:segregation/condensation protein A [Aneurinibacillus tyrosinisolvens]
MDIYDIPMVEITDQYMSHLYVMQQLQIDVASEFLVMAATLLAIKSKTLLPRREEPLFDDIADDFYDENDPREELVQRLLEYRKYKGLAEAFREKEREQSQVYTRPAEDLTPFISPEDDNPISNVTIYDLVDALQKALKRVNRKGLTAKLHREEISLKDRMEEIKSVLAIAGGKVRFSELLENASSKVEIVTSFLAILEMMKKHTIHCEQDGLFKEIVVLLAQGDVS